MKGSWCCDFEEVCEGQLVKHMQCLSELFRKHSKPLNYIENTNTPYITKKNMKMKTTLDDIEIS